MVSLEPISPELCLVCPELRAHMLARLEDDAQPADTARLAPMPIRVGAYLVLRTTQAATECFLVGAAVAALALVATLA